MLASEFAECAPNQDVPHGLQFSPVVNDRNLVTTGIVFTT